MKTDHLFEHPRILLTVPLRPLQGSRFQPTGFPDLDAAEYRTPDGVKMLLVESAQSMANRLEAACWSEADNDWVSALQGLPYVRVNTESGDLLTTSVLESHRLNSPYILESGDASFAKLLKEELGGLETGRVDLQKLATTLLRYDVNALLHGIFLAKKELAGGRLRLPRVISAFIEASDVSVAASGGVKRDDVDPSGTKVGSGSKDGFGHVPFHRDEYTGNLAAFFSIDLAQLRGFRLGPEVEHMLLYLSFFKIRRLLSHGLRLRTACDLEVAGAIRVQRPEGFELPSEAELSEAMPAAIAAAASHFASPAVTTVVYKPKTKSKTKKGSKNDGDGDSE